jgi:Ca-activated chloride channel family protein
LLALCCFAVALARPQLGYTWEESLTEGIDIQIALDVSGSMGAEDFKPKNRLTVAKQVLRRFVAGRPADRIGLVVFSGSTFTRSPLTTDRRMLDFLLDSVELNPVPDGTAIGVALASAAARLEDSTAKTRVVLLVTDGVNTGGEIDPLSAAALCKGLGLKVYTVGVGAKERVAVPMPVSDPVSGERRTESFFINAGVDEPLLRRIAGKTGGRFYKATDRQSLERIFADIDQLEKTPMKVRRYVRYREAFAPFAWAGAGLLLVPLFAAALRATGEP